MAQFKEYVKASTPKGFSLIIFTILYFILFAVSNEYRSNNQKLGTLGPDAQYYLLVFLSIPLLFWPLTSSNEFISENLPPFFRSKPDEGGPVRIFKRFIGGYAAAVVYPFMRLKELLFKKNTNPELATFRVDNFFNYQFMPFVGFVLGVTAIGIAIYFNEHVINSTNSAGIYYVGPDDRTTYQIIFSLLLLIIFFSFVPNKMTLSLEKNWNYYLIFLFATINLIIVDRQLYKNKVIGKNSLWSIYGISIALMIYSLYNLVYTADQSKEFRILSLGKLNDEDRISINQNMFLSYNALRLMLEGGDKYFSGDGRFDVKKLSTEEKDRINPNIVRELQGQTRTGVKELMKRVDSTLIKIFEARLNWEKSVRSYFKERDPNVIDGFFSSKIYQSLYDISVVREDAQKLFDDWQRSRSINQLPNGDITQKVFGAGVGLALGNIAISAVSAQALNSFSKSIDKNLRVLVNRYVFVKLLRKTEDIDAAINNISFSGNKESYSRGSIRLNYQRLRFILENYQNLCELLYDLDMGYNYQKKYDKLNDFVEYEFNTNSSRVNPTIDRLFINKEFLKLMNSNNIQIKRTTRKLLVTQLELLKEAFFKPLINYEITNKELT